MQNTVERDYATPISPVLKGNCPLKVKSLAESYSAGKAKRSVFYITVEGFWLTFLVYYFTFYNYLFISFLKQNALIQPH